MMKMKTNNEIEIVNINDIEDIVLAKHQIDIDNPNITGKSDLNEFINTYCALDAILTDNNTLYIPFSLRILFDKIYVFCSCENESDKTKLIKYLKSIKYDMNNLKAIPISDTVTENFQSKMQNQVCVIYKNKYFLN